MDPLFALITCWISEALKNRKRIGDKGDPCGRPAWGRGANSDEYPFTVILAVRSEQKFSIHFINFGGTRRQASRSISRAFDTPL